MNVDSINCRHSLQAYNTLIFLIPARASTGHHANITWIAPEYLLGISRKVDAVNALALSVRAYSNRCHHALHCAHLLQRALGNAEVELSKA